MYQDDLCMMIAEQYYQAIYRYCYGKLHFHTEAAQDCTQEVFLILIQKKERLDLSGNMKTWLYKTADHVIRNYQRKEKKYQNSIPIDEIELADDSSFPENSAGMLLSCLTEAEYNLLIAYYDAAYGTRNELAAQYGMTLPALYMEINRLRNKVKAHSK